MCVMARNNNPIIRCDGNELFINCTLGATNSNGDAIKLAWRRKETLLFVYFQRCRCTGNILR